MFSPLVYVNQQAKKGDQLEKNSALSSIVHCCEYNIVFDIKMWCSGGPGIVPPYPLPFSMSRKILKLVPGYESDVSELPKQS